MKMEIDLNLVVTIALAIGGLFAAVFTESKYRKAKENVLETVGDTADLLAMIYKLAKAGSCDETSLNAIAKKTEEVWGDLQALGPSFAELLASKSSIAKILSK
jgi:hypothetical protein